MTSPRKSDLPTLLSSVIVFGLLASSPQSLPAQSSSANQNPPAQQEGVTAGDYVIHTSAEIGYRYTNVTGSNDMYDTLVNLQTGPRFLDETFSMQSQDHRGLLFDNLSRQQFRMGRRSQQRVAGQGREKQVVQLSGQLPSRPEFL